MSMISSVALTILCGFLPALQAAERVKPQRDAEPVDLDIEMRSVTGPDGFVEWKMFEKCAWYGKSSYLLRNDDETREFLELMQSHRHINIMQMPRTRARGGELTTGDHKHWLSFPTLQRRPINGNIIFSPQMDPGDIWIGARISTRTVYSRDQKLFDIAIEGEFAQSAGPVNLLLMTNAAGIPFPVVDPRFKKITFENYGTIRAGGALMIRFSAFKVDLGPSPASGPGVTRVSKVPHLNRLFSNLYGINKSQEQAILLITQRLAKPEEEKVIDGVGEEFLQR